MLHVEIYRCDSLRGKHLVSNIPIACTSVKLHNISYTRMYYISYTEEITKNSRFNRDPWRLWKLSLLSKRNVSICFLLLWSVLTLWVLISPSQESFFFQSDTFDTFQVVYIPVCSHRTLQESLEWPNKVTDYLSAGTKTMTGGYILITTYNEPGKSLKIPEILHKQCDLLYIQRSAALEDHTPHIFEDFT